MKWRGKKKETHTGQSGPTVQHTQEHNQTAGRSNSLRKAKDSGTHGNAEEAHAHNNGT